MGGAVDAEDLDAASDLPGLDFGAVDGEVAEAAFGVDEHAGGIDVGAGAVGGVEADAGADVEAGAGLGVDAVVVFWGVAVVGVVDVDRDDPHVGEAVEVDAVAAEAGDVGGGAAVVDDAVLDSRRRP